MTLPLPDPARLAEIEPEVVVLDPHESLWRIYRSGGPFPTTWSAFRHFGPLPSRFDHHLETAEGGPAEQARGICYAATDFVVAVAEVFQASRHIDRRSGDPRVALFQVREAVSLIDLTGPFATRMGAHQGLSNSPVRSTTRAWSRALYDAWPGTGGLLYRSKMGFGQPAVALWERSAGAFPAEPLVDRALGAPELSTALLSAARELGYSCT